MTLNKKRCFLIDRDSNFTAAVRSFVQVCENTGDSDGPLDELPFGKHVTCELNKQKEGINYVVFFKVHFHVWQNERMNLVFLASEKVSFERTCGTNECLVALLPILNC